MLYSGLKYGPGNISEITARIVLHLPQFFHDNLLSVSSARTNHDQQS